MTIFSSGTKTILTFLGMAQASITLDLTICRLIQVLALLSCSIAKLRCWAEDPEPLKEEYGEAGRF